jgi:anti-sigma factor RsiW
MSSGDSGNSGSTASTSEREPTRDELLAMAYVDGELAPDACRELEARLAREPDLAREVSAQKRLAVLAREVAPPEPADHEWRRIERSRTHRGLFVLAWALIAVGGVGLAVFGEFELVESTANAWLKVLITVLCAGLLLLFGLTLRNRLRTKGLDPYTEVKR